MTDEPTFQPEDTPSALADRHASEKALAEMDAALITPLFLVAVVLAVVTLAMVVLTGSPT
ncbi:hypothetical protein N9H60_04185 [Flavimaricola sp.]|nr:hypothetical protein [Flavimaricola sp.]MDA9020349.1 hypothetical protein [Flavimaricola sp.]